MNAFRLILALVLTGWLAACAQQQAAQPGGGAPKGAAPDAPAVGQAAPPEALEAPASEAEIATAPPAADGRVQTDSIGGEKRLTGRLFYLRVGEREPQGAVYYGYLAIGDKVPGARAAAALRGVACRLYVAPTVEAAEAIKDLGLVTLPSYNAATGEITNAAEAMAFYDTRRGGRWVEAAGLAMGVNFDQSKAILFIGSRSPRGTELDGRSLPSPLTDDMVVADASDLDDRYLSRWTHEIVRGVTRGNVTSRQSMQSWMETHSFAMSLTSAFSSWMGISATAQASELPDSCR